MIRSAPNKLWLIGVFLFGSCLVRAQPIPAISLDACHLLAKENYPLIKRYALIEKARQHMVSNAQKRLLPRFNLAAQATYQSEVTQVPISLPDMDIPTMNQDQYNLTTEVSQSITDLFITKDQKEQADILAEIEERQTDVDVYKLRDRVNDLFLGILLIDEQIRQTALLEQDIQRGIDQTNVAISNGVALKSAADNLKAEWLKANQRTIELKTSRKGYADMLSMFIGKTIDENTVLKKPLSPAYADTINRPEVRLFESQKKSFTIQRKILTSKNIPRISLFFKGGYGRPGLNMLSNHFQVYYIGGARLSWNVSELYTYKNDKQILENRQDMVEVQREVFLYNTKLELTQQNAEIDKMEKLIETDKDIIKHLVNVTRSTRNQLKYGAATSNDYLIALHAEDQAKLSLILHKIQLLMKKYDTQTSKGV